MAKSKQLPQSPPLEVRNSEVHGKGVFALRGIKKGERLIEYLGERVSHDEADRRYEEKDENDSHTFLFIVDSKTVIDAGNEGNDARFFNHSCDPNCESTVEKRRVYIDALRDIEPGQEMTYDYQIYREEGDRDLRVPLRVREVSRHDALAHGAEGQAEGQGPKARVRAKPRAAPRARLTRRVRRKARRRSARLPVRSRGSAKSSAAVKSAKGKKSGVRGKSAVAKKSFAGGKSGARAKSGAAAKSAAVGKSGTGKKSVGKSAPARKKSASQATQKTVRRR